MTFSSVVRHLGRSALTEEFHQKLIRRQELKLSGLPRLPKGLVVSSLAQRQQQDLLVVCATLEEAGRWAAQLESMGWSQVLFYPTSEASPYEAFDPESEMVWGQMQALSVIGSQRADRGKGMAIVATEKALQPHLPPRDVFGDYCLGLEKGADIDGKAIAARLEKLGYERVMLVEMEGQWSRRGDIVDIFPVSSELPVRLDFFGDELESIREFDPSTQRSLDKLERLSVTPSKFSPLIGQAIADISPLSLTSEEQEQWAEGNYPEGMQRFLGFAFAEKVASLLDYLPESTVVAVDELDQCLAHGDRTYETIDAQWRLINGEYSLPQIHRSSQASFADLAEKFQRIYLSELDDVTDESINLSSRPLPITPHQFGKLAEILRGKREIYSSITLDKYNTWLVSAQPSRSVSLLQEHDCAAQFIPNPKDFPAIEKHQIQGTAIALKYKGQAELEGFILPTFRIAIVTDREFFGQHTLTNFGYIRKRGRSASKTVDVNKLRPGDYVVHKSHGVGRFIKMETLQSREYLAIKYADGLLRIPADSLDTLSRYRKTGTGRPQLHKMGGKVWESTKNKVRKTVKKLAVDLLKIYAQRSEMQGTIYPVDTPWQQELEDSFPYQATPDQLKAVQDIKRDLESDRPMDRLVCGDVGFGKTEVAVRAIFKAVTSAHKQVALLAPTTILTQQHYHTLKERFSPYPINIGLLNRFRTASEQKDIMERLKSGELDIVVGTQKLLGKEVIFKDLGMLVVDEEQRFGVNQKEKIKAMKSKVDVLTLSATPIPRTLYMSLSGIREMSLITTPPPSRRPIQTHVARYQPDVVRTALRNELDRGGQIFYVVPRVEGIEEIAGQLREMMPSARVAIAHGQMNEAELETTMLTFNNGEADILLCTTIVESGLDIPRVNTIIIEDAQKFGLSQLYQLRGRVGRSGIQAHAWLLYPSKGELTEKATKRLRALQEFSQLGSGYQLAMRDMEIRGVGNLLGAEQSGQMEAIGFELYMEMLQECISEIRGQEIPQVDDCQIDLRLTAFIPGNYITDPEQKLDAYRMITQSSSKAELLRIAAGWTERYGKLPNSVEQLLQVIELKSIAKSLGFSRIKPDAKQHVILETPMEEPAWKRFEEKLPPHLRTRFIYTPKKVTVRGLGAMRPQQQLDSLIEWLGRMQGVLEETAVS
ncbi:MAG: transcription-repair coupling factor [Limnothrix sp. RL_2_0]|nr:transcription-repair coupling factor [Limnothrix sp. RL_2_0]